MRFISPGILDAKVFRKEIEAELKRQAKILKGDFKLITRTWEHKVEFKTDIKFGMEPSVTVSTNDKIFAYLDQGTRAHWVGPKKNGGTLAFHSKYKAKSRPRLIGSVQGGGSGPMAFSKGHYVSGIEPREYFKTMKDIRESGFERAMNKAFEEGCKNVWK
jgi:hypothetical protein